MKGILTYLFVVTHRLNTFLQNLFRVWYSRVIRLYEIKIKTSWKKWERRRSGRKRRNKVWTRMAQLWILTPLHDFVVYVVLGPYHEHIGLLVAMEDRHLFDQGTVAYYRYFCFLTSSELKQSNLHSHSPVCAQRDKMNGRLFWYAMPLNPWWLCRRIFRLGRRPRSLRHRQSGQIFARLAQRRFGRQSSSCIWKLRRRSQFAAWSRFRQFNSNGQRLYGAAAVQFPQSAQLLRWSQTGKDISSWFF